MDKYELAAKYLNLIQRAGARHSARDNDLVQQMHDRACDLGAKCQCEEMGHPMLKAAVEALILRHPGHGSQKVHGNRFGGYSTTKESLRRLKDDKGARERYKASARKKGGASGQSRLSVKPGSFIKQRGTSLTGVVTGKGTIKAGKDTISVFKVRLPSGKTSAIPVRDTDVIAL